MSSNKRNFASSSSSGARGRIAEVLASARASLKEPSRPYTPSSLDQRTTLDLGGPGSSSSGSGRMAPSSSRMRIHSTISASLRSSLSNNYSGSNDASLKDFRADEDDSAERRKKEKRKITAAAEAGVTVLGPTDPNKFKLMLHDIKDGLTFAEHQLLGYAEASLTGEDGAGAGTPFDELALNIDRLAKTIRGDSPLVVECIHEVHSIGLAIMELLFRLASNSTAGSQKLVMCRHALKYYMAFLLNKSGRQHFAFGEICSSLKAVTQWMYKASNELARRNNEADTSSSSSRPGTASSGGISSSGGGGGAGGVSLLPGGVDMLIDLLSAVWVRLPGELSAFVKEEDEKRRHVTSSAVSAGSNLQSDDDFKDETLSDLLDATVYSAAILRLFSNDETDRKRMAIHGVVEVVAEGLAVIESHSVVRQYARQSKLARQNSGSSISTKSSNSSIATLPNCRTTKVLKKLSQVMVQLVGAVRNFSVDSSGRSQLLQSKLVCRLCTLQHVFTVYPELLLNCARATAKLSLLDPFRTQINSKPMHLKCLADVVINEAMMCKKIMDGAGCDDDDVVDGGDDDSNEKEEDDQEGDGDGESTWPGWYTWPLISRVCFTLGNLTTTNEANRALIGLECKILKPLVLLLQACSGTLVRLDESKNEDEGEDDDEEEEEEEEDDKDRTTAPRKAVSGKQQLLKQRKGKGSRSHDYGSEDYSSNSDNSDSDDGDGDVDNTNQDGEGGQGTEDNSAELELMDATVKLLRLLANLSIDKTIGAAVGSNFECISILSDLLLFATSSPEYEELLLNVVATCTNVTYYASQHLTELLNRSNSRMDQLRNASTEGGSVTDYRSEMKVALKLEKHLTALSVHLSHCLFHENEEVQLETARVLGNLTRRPGPVKSLVRSRSDEAMVMLLGHSNMDIVAAVTGALVNMSSDSGEEGGREALMKKSHGTNTVHCLTSLLRRLSFRDMPLSTLICQVLHNLFYVPASDDEEVCDEEIGGGGRPPSSTLGISGETRTLLRDTLEELLDCVHEMREDVCETIDAQDKEAAAAADGLSGDSGSDALSADCGGEQQAKWEARADDIMTVERYLAFEKVGQAVFDLLGAQ